MSIQGITTSRNIAIGFTAGFAALTLAGMGALAFLHFHQGMGFDTLLMEGIGGGAGVGLIGTGISGAVLGVYEKRRKALAKPTGMSHKLQEGVTTILEHTPEQKPKNLLDVTPSKDWLEEDLKTVAIKIAPPKKQEEQPSDPTQPGATKAAFAQALKKSPKPQASTTTTTTITFGAGEF